MSETTKKIVQPHPSIIGLLNTVCRWQKETIHYYIERTYLRLKRDRPVAVHVHSQTAETKNIFPKTIEIIPRNLYNPETTI